MKNPSVRVLRGAVTSAICPTCGEEVEGSDFHIVYYEPRAYVETLFRCSRLHVFFVSNEREEVVAT